MTLKTNQNSMVLTAINFTTETNKPSKLNLLIEPLSKSVLEKQGFANFKISICSFFPQANESRLLRNTYVCAHMYWMWKQLVKRKDMGLGKSKEQACGRVFSEQWETKQCKYSLKFQNRKKIWWRRKMRKRAFDLSPKLGKKSQFSDNLLSP